MDLYEYLLGIGVWWRGMFTSMEIVGFNLFGWGGGFGEIDMIYIKIYNKVLIIIIIESYKIKIKYNGLGDVLEK